MLVISDAHIWASRCIHMEAFPCAGAILAKTLEPSLRLVPSARRVMLPVSSHGTAYKDRREIVRIQDVRSERRRGEENSPSRKYSLEWKGFHPESKG